jgi:YwqJ-like deaminase
MEDFEGLIEFLRLNRRSDEAKARGPELPSELMLTTLEDTEVYSVSRETFESDFETYRRLVSIFEIHDPEYIYLEENNGQRKYYILNTQEQYVNLRNNQVETPTQQELHQFPVIYEFNQYFYDIEINKVVTSGNYLETIPLFFDNIPFDPRGQYLDAVKSTQYDYDFENHRSSWANLVEFFGERFTHESKVDVRKGTLMGTAYIIPTMEVIFNNPFQYKLKYPYVINGYTPTIMLPDDDCALVLKFYDVSGLLSFLNETLFSQGFDMELTQESRRDELRKVFRKEILDRLEYNYYGITSTTQFHEILKVLYYLPENIAKEINQNVTWSLFEIGLKGEGFSNNLDVAAEDVFVKLIDLLVLQGQSKKLLDFLGKKFDDTDTLWLERLDKKIDGGNNSKLAYSISKAWLSTSYPYPYDEENKKLYATSDGPLLLPYQSEKWLGLYFDNAKISWDTNKKNQRLVKVVLKTGQRENRLATNPTEGLPDDITEEFWYHPYHPLYIKNVEKQYTSLQLSAIVPAYMLLANDRKQFWHNVVTGGEYVLDVLAIASGVGVLAEISYGIVSTLSILRGIGAVAGLSSGIASAAMKLTNATDSKLGQTLCEYLFWIEMASLAGQLTVSIRKGLKQSALQLVEQQDDVLRLEKQLDEVVIEEQNGTTRRLNQEEKDNFLDDLEEKAGLSETSGGTRKKRIKYKGKIFIKKKPLQNLLREYVDEATVLWKDPASRPGAVAALEGEINGKVYQVLSYSSKGISKSVIVGRRHTLVHEWLTEIAKGIDNGHLLKRATHGRCAEPVCISEFLFEAERQLGLKANSMKIEQARVILGKTKSKAIAIYNTKNSKLVHGLDKKACRSCNPLLKYFGITEIK